MSEPVHQAETPQTPSAPMTLAQKLGCLMMIVIALVITLFWWALRNPEERWAESEVAMMTMSWPDQVVAVKTLGEPQRSEAATRLVDAWLRQPDMPRDWHVGANVKITKAVRDRTIQILIENADRSAREAIAKQEAQKARLAAAPKYTTFTPPPVDEHLAKGGEVWGRLAPPEQAVSGGGIREFWLLSPNRKRMEALVTMSAVDDPARYASDSWYDVTPFVAQSYKHTTERSALELTPSVSATQVVLNGFLIETNDSPNGLVRTQYSSIVTLEFPDSANKLDATGSTRGVLVILQNGKQLGSPKQTKTDESFHRVSVPNPPRK